MGWKTNVNDIMECIQATSTMLPLLRDKLDITQQDFAKTIGISRQSLIGLEHQEHKITKSVLISVITYFLHRKETAKILFDNGVYNNEFVRELGVSEDIIIGMHGFEDDEIE